MTLQIFPSAWLDFTRIWLAAVPNSTAVLARSGFWPYQVIFHYWMFWQALWTDMRKERFLTWISVSQFFVLNQYVAVFFVHKGQLEMYKIWKECVPKKGHLLLWRWNEIICRLSQWEELPSFFFSLKQRVSVPKP